MSDFQLPADLKFNRGMVQDPDAFAKESGSVSWLFLVGDEFASMPGGISYAQVQQAVVHSARVVSDPPRVLTLDLARQQVDALDRLPRPTLVTCRSGPRGSAAAYMYAGLKAGASYEEVLAAAERDQAPFCASDETKDWVRSSMEALRSERAGQGDRGRMATTEWWQRGVVEGVPAVLQPVAHILLQVRESVGELVENLTPAEWNARPGGVASAAFHVRHITGVIDRLFTYARGSALSAEQFAAIQSDGAELSASDVEAVLAALSARVDAAVAELRTIDVATLGDFRGVGRARLPSTVIGCLVHGAEHSMRHVGALSVTVRVVRSGRA